MAITTKKPAAKPAAKKTTTTKPAAKKTTAAKPAAKKAAPTKKTTTAKPAVKKTPAAKPAAKKAAPVKTAVEISVNGNKKIGTLMKEFNKQFPYIRLGIFYSYARQEVAKVEPYTILMQTRHSPRCAAPTQVATFPSAATKRSRPLRKSSTLSLASMLRYAIPQRMATATTPVVVLTI